MPVKKSHQIYEEIISRKNTAGMYSYLVRIIDYSGVSLKWMQAYELPMETIVSFEREIKKNLALSRKKRLDRRNCAKSKKHPPKK